MPGLAGLIFAIAVAIAVVHPGSTPAAAADAPGSYDERALLADLLRRADQEELHEDAQWHALLHYEQAWFPPGLRSPALTSSFFLHPHGDRDPRAELRATLKAFFDPAAIVKDDEHAQCAFVARRHWLLQRLGRDLTDLPAVPCPHYERWRDGIDGHGLTLIFPEGFMNNPASMFGHTLLRVDSIREGGVEDVLGYAVDFTADVGEDDGFVYVIKGVVGSYPAFFAIHPYYQQLKRYADWENRDIWEYRLDVSEEELAFLLMHLWELRAVEFPYYFFTKNCSYELLRLLDISIRDLDASDRFRGPVIPVDTVRVLVERPGFVQEIRYRPSPETELRTQLRSLSPEDRNRVEAIVDGTLDPAAPALENIAPGPHGRILDVAYAQLRYEYLAGQVEEATSRSLSRRILVARSRVGAPEDAEVPEIPVPEVRPDQGHASSLVSLRPGWRDDDVFVDLEWRPAFHSLIDNGGGYPNHMQIRMLDTRLRIYPESGRVRLDELTLVEATSLNPRSMIFRPWAWSVGTGLRTRRVPDRRGFDDAAVWGTRGGAGLSLDPHPAVLLYGLADMALDVGPDLEDDVSFGPGARAGVFLGRADRPWFGHLFGEVTRFVAGETTTWARGGGELRLTTSRNTAVVLEATGNLIHGKSWLETAVRLNVYY